LHLKVQAHVVLYKIKSPVLADNSSYNLQKSIRKRLWIAILLFLSTIMTSLLLWKSDPVVQKKLRSTAELDSLITSVFDHTGLPGNQRSHTRIRTGTDFSRSVYRVRVAPNFSKTSLHVALQQVVWPYRVSVAGKVEFPARTLYIHFMVNDNILSSVVVMDDPDLQLRQSQPETLPGQDSHEVD
jgi:hypothetical protein